MTKLRSLMLIAAAFLPAGAAQARPMTAHDLASLRRIAGLAVSPDGRWAAWSQRETDWAANRGRFDLWALDLARAGAAPIKVAADAQANETDPAFTADGTLWYLSDAGGHSAVWSASILARRAPGRVTPETLVDIEGFLPSPRGDRLLVWASSGLKATDIAQATEEKASEGTGRTYDKLFVRHWDSWSNASRNRLFVLPVASGQATGAGVAVSAGLEGDSPSKPQGGREELAWSPDGRTVYFALREAGRIESLSTNLDIFSVPADGSAPPTNLTAGNKATDTLPAVSPDGKTLAYVAMARAGYEADRQVIQLRDLATGQARALTAAWDRSVDQLAWAPDGKSLLVVALDNFDHALFRVDAKTGKVSRLTGAGSVTQVQPVGSKGLVVARESLLAPADLWRMPANGGEGTRLTRLNEDLLSGIDMPAAEKFSFTGADGDTVWGFALRPAGTAPNAKLPVAYLIHGGPQGSFGNAWSYRWNPALFAAAGYATVLIDFHGSTGHGQAFTDAIRGDWGGKPLADLKLGLAAASAKFGWLDTARACALGGSYGGYMTNWIAGNWTDGFRCLVTHAGVFDARAMAYETEELWFDEWEHGGKAYYEDPQAYERWNPVNHVAQWKTPMLVLHGEKDFRIPYTQGLGAYTALQRREIPSRLVVFPDENHWILKPRNSEQWYGEVFAWLGRWTGAAASQSTGE